MIRKAARSLPRRERSSPAMLVVTNRASVMQNSTCSTTATTATSRPSAPRASPTVTPSRPIRLASGQAPVAEAASRPDGERAGPQRVQGQRGRVQGAVQAEGEERQDQPAEREQR